ncbi:hypothetical protein [Nocardia otitidiscaviarum]|uniref:hypothetical protein n=1 Tax=Nocardia otitidiscaviarum TaxID=1823 RepID=UPI002455D920|nr:hypothetical protein [Nocardia otitidiscaviarum]
MNRADTAQILAHIAEYDHRAIDADTITHWHHHIGHLDPATAREAVAIHHKLNPWKCTPESVLDIASQIPTRTTTEHPMRRARTGAYTITGALNDPCTDCGAPAGEFCTDTDNQQKAAPHISRLLGRPVAHPPQRRNGRRIA